MTTKDDAQRLGDAAQDGSQALHDLGDGDPNAVAHDASRGLRALGLDSVADALDDAVGMLEDGPLPDMTYDLYFGDPGIADKAAGMAEGLASQGVNALGGGLLGGIANKVLDRTEDLVDDNLAGSSSPWMLATFKLTEEFSRPWVMQMTLVRQEIAPPAAGAGDAGPLTKLGSFVEDIKQGGMKSILKDAENAVMDATGLSSPTDSSAADQPPQTGVPIDPANFLNQTVSLNFSRRNKDKKPAVERWLTGIVSEFEDLGGVMTASSGTLQATQSGYRFINLTVVPSLWKLSLRRDCRIFQDMNAIEIIREVFETGGVYAGLTHGMLSFVDNQTDGVHLVPPANVNRGDWTPKREMCVQYNETDLDFVHRLLESEGISYFFDCQKRIERIVFFEDPTSIDGCKTVDGEPVPFARTDEILYPHPPPDANSPALGTVLGSTPRWDDKNARKGQTECVWSFAEAQSVQPKKITLRDYNFRLAAMPPLPSPLSPLPDKEQVPFVQDVDSDSVARTARPYESKIPASSLATGVQISYPHVLTPPPDPTDPNKQAGSYVPAPNSVVDPAARLRDAYRCREEVATGIGNVTTVRPGGVVGMIGFIDYRSGADSSIQVPALTAPTDPPTGTSLADKQASAVGAIQSWRQANDNAEGARNVRDAVFKKPMKLLVTKVTHYGQRPAHQTPAIPSWVGPTNIESSRTRWLPNGSALNAPPTWAATAGFFVGPLQTTGKVTHTVDNNALSSTTSPLLQFTPPAGPGDVCTQNFYNEFECIILEQGANATNVYRPLPATPKPKIRGLQTALVVNADNHFTDGLENQLNVDRLGHRVKVHFHWDRRGDALLQKRKSSCWVPVAPLWAGQSESATREWGTTFIPRAGMEAVVGFIDGDPDRPIILGCVPNGHKPAVTVPLPRPTVLRSDPKGGDDKPVITDDPPAPTSEPSLADGVHTYRSVIKSQSEPYSQGTGNWIVFDDNVKKEWVQIRAQNKLIKQVENLYSVKVGEPTNDYGSDPHRQILAIKRDQHETLEQTQTVTVGADRTKTVKMHETIVIQGDHHQHIVAGPEIIAIDRGRVETIQGTDHVDVGPQTADENEHPDTPSRQVTLNGSQLLTTKKREKDGDSPEDAGDEIIHVKKSKTDTIAKKLSVEAKGGVSVRVTGQDATGLEVGDPTWTADRSSPQDHGLVNIKSADDIHLSSAGVVAIRSDNNDVMLEADQHVRITAQRDVLRLTMKDPDSDTDDLVLAGGTNTAGVKGIRITVGGDDSQQKTTMTLSDEGILIAIDGTNPASIKVVKNAAITLTGENLDMHASGLISLGGAVTFKPR